jgi:Phenylpropionate dioxygenase and related ring-hydroxylating dioxygenases, large terminal subunit
MYLFSILTLFNVQVLQCKAWSCYNYHRCKRATTRNDDDHGSRVISRTRDRLVTSTSTCGSRSLVSLSSSLLSGPFPPISSIVSNVPNRLRKKWSLSSCGDQGGHGMRRNDVHVGKKVMIREEAVSMSPAMSTTTRSSSTTVTCLCTSIGTSERESEMNEENSCRELGKEESGMMGAWIPLASAQGLTGLGPQRVRVMGIDLVVWYAEKGDEKVWSAQIDACTHRLAPLSQGRVNPKTNCIECPYHGWQFDSKGTVTCIPQLETNRSIESVRNQGGNVKTFPVHAVGDLLFVFLPSSIHGETFEQSLLPEDYYYPYLSSFMKQDQGDGKQSPGQVFVRELPYSFDFLVENFMDPAHIPFAHHKLQSTRADGVPIEMSEISSNFTHVVVGFKDVTRNRPRDAYASFNDLLAITMENMVATRALMKRQDSLNSVYGLHPSKLGNVGCFSNPLPSNCLHFSFTRVAIDS